MSDRILDVKDLSIEFRGKEVVRDVNFHIDRGETVGLVGELQAGKSSRNKRVSLSGSCRPVRPMKMVNRFVRQQRASCRLPRRTLIQQKGQESDLLTCIIADPS